MKHRLKNLKRAGDAAHREGLTFEPNIEKRKTGSKQTSKRARRLSTSGAPGKKEKTLLLPGICLVPGGVPADGPYRGQRAPWPLNLHLLLTILVVDADDPVHHPYSQVLPIVGPAVLIRAGEGKQSQTSLEAAAASQGFILPA